MSWLHYTLDSSLWPPAASFITTKFVFVTFIISSTCNRWPSPSCNSHNITHWKSTCTYLTLTYVLETPSIIVFVCWKCLAEMANSSFSCNATNEVYIDFWNTQHCRERQSLSSEMMICTWLVSFYLMSYMAYK